MADWSQMGHVTPASGTSEHDPSSSNRRSVGQRVENAPSSIGKGHYTRLVSNKYRPLKVIEERENDDASVA
jgi:hypothetical protein